MADEEKLIELDPEWAALLRKQFEIDYEEAGPRAPFHHIIHKGVRIESRWAVLRELHVMQKAIDNMPDLMARRITWMWCNSKCGSNFIIGVKSSLYVDHLKRSIADAFRAANGGHNGIIIEDGETVFTGETLADIDPDWEGDCT